jgi:ADP-heptose:LPS heptosyltransferase
MSEENPLLRTSPLLYDNPIKIKLNNHQAPGDTLMMTCAVRDLKKAYPRYKIKVSSTAPRLWDNNPYLSSFDEPDLDLKVGPKIATQSSKSSGLHFANAFRVCLESILNIRIPQGPIKPDLHLSAWEREREPIIKGQYWLVTAGGKPDFSAKIWPFDRWQAVIDKLPHLNFVQIGEAKHGHNRLQGDNVIDFIGKTEDRDTGLRDLLNLFYHCEGSLGLVSLQMHLAAAFDKPCVVVAGAREPSQWESYPYHRYLSTQGTIRCEKGAGFQQVPTLNDSCWRAKLEACTNHVKQSDGTGIPKCIDMISVEDVVSNISMYYDGGRLISPETKAVYITKKKPVFKMICNAHAYIGGERSCVSIMQGMRKEGYAIELIPTKNICPEFRRALGGGIKVTNDISGHCDILVFYTNDRVWEFHTDTYKIMNELNAVKKYMVLNFRLGKAGQVPWTKDWDGYFFLNNDLRDKLIQRIPDASTVVLAPPVDLTPFLGVKPKYNQTLHMLRHSSQGDSKYPKNLTDIVRHMTKVHPNIKFDFMPAPSFLDRGIPGVHAHPVNGIPVPDFLSTGNCFWYMLPEGYGDMGPRVIVEAMAAGLPVVADNRDGAKDRVTEDTGWLCNSVEEYYAIIEGLNHKVLKEKGEAAKERASKVFDPGNWIKAIT